MIEFAVAPLRSEGFDLFFRPVRPVSTAVIQGFSHKVLEQIGGDVSDFPKADWWISRILQTQLNQNKQVPFFGTLEPSISD